MKAFWITIVAVIVLLIMWGLFLISSDADIHNMTANIQAAESLIYIDNWQGSRDAIEQVSSQWYSRRLIFSLFFDAISIGEVEGSLNRVEAYSLAEEKGSALAELAYLRHLLLFLFENETISVENIL